MVTGCAGYIGSRLCKQLITEGHKVTGVDNLMYHQHGVVFEILRNEKKVVTPNFLMLPYDICQDAWLTMVPKQDIVIHLAALVGAPICSKNTDEYVKEVNLNSVRRLVDAMSKKQVLIYPNTNSGYGISGDVDLCTEETPITPISTYGVTKCEAEKTVLERKNSVAFRLATVFGTSPRMRFDLMVNDFIWKAVINKKIEVFEPNFRRNFIHIQDVCDAFKYAINNVKAMGGNVYNLGLDEANTTKGKLAETICGVVGGEVTYMEGKDPDKRDYNVSSAKLAAAGFKPYVSLNYGIQEVQRDILKTLQSDAGTGIALSTRLKLCRNA